MPRMLIETARLLLRNLVPEDIPDLVQMWTDVEVTRFLGGPRQAGWLEANFAEEARAADPPLYDQWPVIEKASGKLVGYCGLIDKEIEGRAEIELVYAFLPSAWGKGYASEIARALREHGVQRLRLPRLVALIEPENQASVHVAEAAGFHFERSVRRPAGLMHLYVHEPPHAAAHAGQKEQRMSVKHAHEVPASKVAAGQDTTIQVLISAQEGPNFALRRFSMQPGGGMPPHTNAVEHEQYVLRGRARVGIAGQMHEVVAGDVVLIPAGAVHSYENIGEEPFEFLCIVPNQEDRITIVDAASC